MGHPFATFGSPQCAFRAILQSFKNHWFNVFLSIQVIWKASEGPGKPCGVLERSSLGLTSLKVMTSADIFGFYNRPKGVNGC